MNRVALMATAAVATPFISLTAQRPLPGGTENVAIPSLAIDARQSGPAEITISWSTLRGVSTYYISRLAPPSGWQRLYPANATDTVFIDRNVAVGRKYTYQVAAQLGARVTPRVTSDTILVAESFVATPVSDSAPPATEVPDRNAIVERAYMTGRARHTRWWLKGERLWRARWIETAMGSSLTEQELVTSWRHIATAAVLYGAVLSRAPNGEELSRQIALLAAGKDWRVIWRELAQSPEREQRFGFWASAPMSLQDAKATFGFPTLRTAEQCFGGVGPKCEGGVPDLYAWVHPRWHNYFTMPDGTEMAYVEMGVVVGSILHDNVCMDAQQGTAIACQGWELVTDLTKHGGVPGALEWHKATWNVIDGRGWRAVFGPYPTNMSARRSWYDDVRPVRARRTMMAAPVGPLGLPILDQPYRGQERRATIVLTAPPGTKLDGTDAAFCTSKKFKSEESPLAKAPLGTCW
ncbi:MAG TPA: hypothetical protein VJ672_13680 [Gemmatimonadaceae bacterium]|nr:hypothetical protein [Gemmatimonadaceae bacterium]